MDLCRQWFIYGKINKPAPEGYDETNKDQPMYDPEAKHGDPIKGGIANGYKKEDLIKFWHDIEGYCNYLFNLSHSACYSYITVMTAYLKRYYPVQFMAALLSAEDKKEKVANYISVAERMGIDIRVPDINLSKKYFTPNNNSILYGLTGVKGVGETSIPEIIANRPYTSLADIMDKVPKKSFNKRVGLALIKAGAMDSFNENRHNLINQFYELRKDKDERLDEDAYDETACIEFEREVLGAPVTYKPWWNTIEPGTKVTQPMELVSVAEKTDRNGRLMAFLTLKYKGSTIKGVIFASYYRKYVGLLDTERYTHAVITGKKDDKGSIIVSKVTEYKQEIDETEERFHRILA